MMDAACFNIKLSATNSEALDHNVSAWSVHRCCRSFPNFLHNIHSLRDLSENSVTVVKMRSRSESDEELRSICPRTSVGHREKSRLGVLDGEVLIGKFLTIDGLSTSALYYCQHETNIL